MFYLQVQNISVLAEKELEKNKGSQREKIKRENKEQEKRNKNNKKGVIIVRGILWERLKSYYHVNC